MRDDHRRAATRGCEMVVGRQRRGHVVATGEGRHEVAWPRAAARRWQWRKRRSAARMAHIGDGTTAIRQGRGAPSAEVVAGY